MRNILVCNSTHSIIELLIPDNGSANAGGNVEAVRQHPPEIADGAFRLNVAPHDVQTEAHGTGVDPGLGH